MVTISYAFFPHIFSEIISQCDFKTQNKLRLLCSAVKRDIDQVQCSAICFQFNPTPVKGGPHSSHPEHVTIEMFSWTDPYRDYVPALCPDVVKGNTELNIITGIQPEYVTALRNADMVGTMSDALMWDELWSSNSKLAGTSYYSPFKLLEKATRMQLLMGDYDAPPGATVPAEVAIPSTIQELELCADGLDQWMTRSVLSHNCRSLRIHVFLGRMAEFNFFLGLLRPCVQNLVLSSNGDDAITNYVNAIKGKELHPDLRIEVCTGYHPREWNEEKALKLRDKLAALVPAAVTVRQYDRDIDLDWYLHPA